MKLYYRENGALKCENVDRYMGRDKVAIVIDDDGMNVYVEICVYEHAYCYDTYLITEIEDM